MSPRLTSRIPCLRMGTASLLALLLFTAAGCTDVAAPDSGSPMRALRSSMTVGVTPAVAAGYFQTCALRSTGVIECWGGNYYDNAPPLKTAAVGYFTQISGGFASTCALRSDGAIECFGDNLTGDGPPLKTAATGVFTQIGDGDLAIRCAVRSDGAFECWGDYASMYAPAARTPLTGVFTQVSAAEPGACALRSDGARECWVTDYSTSPAQVVHEVTRALEGSFTQVSVSPYHRCGLTTLGRIECLGSNHSGQAPATWTAAVGYFTAMSTGRSRTCGVRSDGVLECRGYNDDGAAPPTRTARTGSYTQVSNNYYHGCAMTTAELVECWGRSDHPIVRSEQRITFTYSVPRLTIGSQYSAAATATAGLPVTLTGLTNAVCTLNGTTVTVVAEGTCSVAAEQGGNNANLPAPPAAQTVQVIAGPASVSVGSATAASIVVNWVDASAIETHFRVQRRTGNGDGSWSGWLNLAAPPANAFSYTDALVTPGLGYQYRTQACMGSLCSAWISSRTVILEASPTVPANLYLQVVSETHIDLAWPDVANETRYELMRQTETAGIRSSWNLLAVVAANSTTYADLTVDPNTRFRYRVRACNIAGCSNWIASSRVVTQVVPTIPTTLAATAVSATQVDLSWQDTSSEDRFELQRAVSGGGWIWLAHPPANATSFSDLTANSATAYHYRIRACNIAGCSRFSAYVNVTTP